MCLETHPTCLLLKLIYLSQNGQLSPENHSEIEICFNEKDYNTLMTIWILLPLASLFYYSFFFFPFTYPDEYFKINSPINIMYKEPFICFGKNQRDKKKKKKEEKN